MGQFEQKLTHYQYQRLAISAAADESRAAAGSPARLVLAGWGADRRSSRSDESDQASGLLSTRLTHRECRL